MYKKNVCTFLAIFGVLVILTGCFNKESLEEMDAPQTEDTEKTASHLQENESDMIPRELYFIDASGMVAAQTIELPLKASKRVAKQVLEHLIIDGPGTSKIPNGFRAVLPEGTEILGLNLQEDGTIVVDVSEEFNEYPSKDEVQILEAMTYSLTQFENIDMMQLRVNGYDQEVMPVNGTPIGKGYTRNRGINVMQTDTVDFLQSDAVTVYYPTEYNETRYYVPVTQYVSGEEENKYGALIEALIDGPKYNILQISHVFNPQTALMSDPVLEDGVLDIVFNDQILKDADNAVISDEVIETLVRTLTKDEAVEAIQVQVENVEVLQSETGELYDEPVTTEAFSTKEKL